MFKRDIERWGSREKKKPLVSKESLGLIRLIKALEDLDDAENRLDLVLAGLEEKKYSYPE